MLRVQLQPVGARTAAELEGAFAAMARARAQAVLVLGAAIFLAERQRVAELAIKHRLPTMSMLKDVVEAGGLMSYSPNFDDLYRRGAIYVDKILKGAKPADLPMEQATKFELVINLKTAKALGLTIPQSLWCARTRLSSDDMPPNIRYNVTEGSRCSPRPLTRRCAGDEWERTPWAAYRRSPEGEHERARWNGFLAAKGVDNLFVLHGGATAVFRVGSLSEAARLAEAVAKAPGFSAGVPLTLADARVAVRLSRDIWNLEARHVQLRGPFRQSRGNTVRSPIVRPSRKCRSPLRRSAMRLTLVFGAPSSATPRWPTTMRSRPLDTDRRSGCRCRPGQPLRHAMHIDVSVARARQGAARGSGRGGRPYRRRVACTIELDARRPRGQPRLYLRVASWSTHRPLDGPA